MASSSTTTSASGLTLETVVPHLHLSHASVQALQKFHYFRNPDPFNVRKYGKLTYSEKSILCKTGMSMFDFKKVESFMNWYTFDCNANPTIAVSYFDAEEGKDSTLLSVLKDFEEEQKLKRDQTIRLSVIVAGGLFAIAILLILIMGVVFLRSIEQTEEKQAAIALAALDKQCSMNMNSIVVDSCDRAGCICCYEIEASTGVMSKCVHSA